MVDVPRSAAVVHLGDIENTEDGRATWTKAGEDGTPLAGAGFTLTMGEQKVVVDDFNAHLAEAKEKVAATDAGKFVYFDGWIQGGNVSIRPFGQGSLMGELGEELGLENAWTGKVDPAYGLGQTDIEGMSELGDATFFYTGTVDPEGDVNAALAENAVWQKIPAVAEGRAHAFPAGVWTFGGPRTAEQVIDAYVDLLTK